MGLSYEKGLISPLSLLLQVWNVKTTYRKSCLGNLFQLLTLSFDLFFSVKWGHLTTKDLYLPLFSIITDPKAGDSHCSSSLIVSPDESRGYLGFSTVTPLPPPQRFSFGRDNLKNILVRPFKFGMWVHMGNATKALVL